MNSAEFSAYLAAQSATAKAHRAKQERKAFAAFWEANQHLNYGEAREAMAARDAEAAGDLPVAP